jgi:hypothetical protein
MTPRQTKQARLDVAAHERLMELQKALGSQGLPDYTEITDILSAIVLYTTPEQLAGMVVEYWRFTARRATAGAEANEDQTDQAR